MKNKTIKEFNKKELMKEIADFYGYDILFLENNQGSVVISNGQTQQIHRNTELALLDWLDTLVESEIEHKKTNSDSLWDEEIKYIKNIEKNIVLNNPKDILNAKLRIYGDTPKDILEKITTAFMYASDGVSRFMDMFANNKSSDGSRDTLLVASLPVRLIVQEGKLEYVKMANKNFFERIFYDDSELEWYEYDVFDERGLVTDFLPLFPINSIEKIDFNIPIVIASNGSSVKIVSTSISYRDFF